MVAENHRLISYFNNLLGANTNLDFILNEFRRELKKSVRTDLITVDEFDKFMETAVIIANVIFHFDEI